MSSLFLLFSLVILLVSIHSLEAFAPAHLHSKDSRNNCGILSRPQLQLYSALTSVNQTLLEVPSGASSGAIEVPFLSRFTSPPSSEEEDERQSEQEQLLTQPSLPVRPRKNGKAAIVLNVNARLVTPDLVDIANEVFGQEHVFLTSTAQEARTAAQHVVEQHYSLVIPVGGDGTLSSLLDMLVKEIMVQQTDAEHNVTISIEEAMKELPLVGYIPLGTGNGVGSVVGVSTVKKRGWMMRKLVPGAAKRKRTHDLKELFERLSFVASSSSSLQEPVDDGDSYDIVELPMMQVTLKQAHGGGNFDGNKVSPPTTSERRRSELCFFAGIGFDSLMLNDFKEIKAWSQRTKVLPKLFSSVTGYCVALVVKTLPKCVLRQEHNVEVQVTSRHAEETTWIDHRRGDLMRKVLPVSSEPSWSEPLSESSTSQPTLLYRGTTGILAAGTSPFYGGGLRLFPFARMTLDKMHLRLGRIHPLTGVVNIPKIFAGSYRDLSDDKFGCIDLVGTEFDVEVIQDDEERKADEQWNKNRDKTVVGFPFQHSGESIGHTESFRLRVVKEPVRFVSFMEKNWHSRTLTASRNNGDNDDGGNDEGADDD